MGWTGGTGWEEVGGDLGLAVKHYRAPVYCIMQCPLPDRSSREISTSARHIDDQHSHAAMPRQQQCAADEPIDFPRSRIHCSPPPIIYDDNVKTLCFASASPAYPVHAQHAFIRPTAIARVRTWTQKHKSGLAPTTAFDTKAPSNVHLVAPARHSCNAINLPWLI